jgi:hypothetical protein
LANSLKPGQGVSTYEYTKMLYAVASSGPNAASIKGQIADRMRRNSKDAASRLESSSGDRGTLKVPNKKMTARESAEFAVKQILGNKDD